MSDSMSAGIPGVDYGQVSSAALEKTIRSDPQVHKYVDSTSNGLRRFFDALDTDFDGVLSLTELQEGFQRTLDDFCIWIETPAFMAHWLQTWSSLLQVLAELRQVRE